MNQAHLSYEQLEHNLITWAQSQPAVQAAVVVGSRARLDHPANRWSDLDLILLTTSPASYTQADCWPS